MSNKAVTQMTDPEYTVEFDGKETYVMRNGVKVAMRRARESVALWHWADDCYENELIWREVWAQAKEEVRALDAPIHQLKRNGRATGDPPTS